MFYRAGSGDEAKVAELESENQRLLDEVWQWEGEAEEAEESTVTFGQLEVPARKLMTFVDISNELLADSGGTAETEVRLALAEDFGKKEGSAFVNGSGVKEPEGIPRREATLKVLTYNTHLFSGSPFAPQFQESERAELIGDWLWEQDADVIGLNEVWQPWVFETIWERAGRSSGWWPGTGDADCHFQSVIGSGLALLFAASSL